MNSTKIFILFLITYFFSVKAYSQIVNPDLKVLKKSFKKLQIDLKKDNEHNWRHPARFEFVGDNHDSLFYKQDTILFFSSLSDYLKQYKPSCPRIEIYFSKQKKLHFGWIMCTGFSLIEGTYIVNHKGIFKCKQITPKYTLYSKNGKSYMTIMRNKKADERYYFFKMDEKQDKETKKTSFIYTLIRMH